MTRKEPGPGSSYDSDESARRLGSTRLGRVGAGPRKPRTHVQATESGPGAREPAWSPEVGGVRRGGPAPRLGSEPREAPLRNRLKSAAAHPLRVRACRGAAPRRASRRGRRRSERLLQSRPEKPRLKSVSRGASSVTDRKDRRRGFGSSGAAGRPREREPLRLGEAQGAPGGAGAEETARAGPARRRCWPNRGLFYW